MVSGSFLSILRCSPSGSLYLYGSKTSNWFLTCSSSTAGVLFPEPFLSIEIRETLLKKAEKRFEHFSLIHGTTAVLLNQSHNSATRLSPVQSFTANKSQKFFLLTLMPCKHQFQVSFGSPTTIPTGWPVFAHRCKCSPHLLLPPFPATRLLHITREQPWVPCIDKKVIQCIYLHSWPSLAFGRCCSLLTPLLFRAVWNPQGFHPYPYPA